MLRKLIFLAIGLGLLALVLRAVDLEQVLDQALGVGWGLLLLAGLYLVAFVADAIAWQITLRPAPKTAAWLYRIWKVRMVGEAVNLLIPAAGLGGEPLKAILLRRHYGIPWRDGIASLILSQTIIVIAMVMFLAAGFCLMLASDTLPDAFYLVGGVGLAVLLVATMAIFLLPWLRPSAFFLRWLERFRLGGRLASALRSAQAIESELIDFYGRNRTGFAAATAMSLISWLIGVAEIYYGARLIDQPVGWREAWIVEAAVQMVRAGAFFVPAGLGAQEGAFLVTAAAIGGSPAFGVALALLRRFREILWIVWGMLIGLSFPSGPRGTAEAPDGPAP